MLILLSTTVLAVEPGDIIKKTNGSILYTTKANAEKKCEEFGLRLPTFREYAEYAVSFGAKIRESSFKGKNINHPEVSQEIIQNMQNGYELQTAHLNGQDVIDYYYNSRGYKMPAEEEMDNSCFWTTTPANDYGRWSLSVFCSRDGSKSTATQNASLAVRCISHF